MSQQCCPTTPEQRDRNLASAINFRAFNLAISGNRPLSMSLVSAAHGLLQASGGYFNDAGIWVYNTDGVLALLGGDFAGAEECFRKALNVSVSLFGKESVQTATFENNLAQALSAGAKYDEADALFVKAIATLEAIKSKADEHTNMANLDGVLADAAKEYANMKTARDATKTAPAPEVPPQSTAA